MNLYGGAMYCEAEIARYRQLARRKRQQGITLIEMMIVLVIIAMIAGGVAVALLPRLEESRIKTTRTDAQAMRSVITLYLGDNPRSCPTVDDLLDGRYLDAQKRTTDAWDSPFQISCEDGDIMVISSGPDGQFGTEDDIH
jgi:general secretion pathway protein G